MDMRRRLTIYRHLNWKATWRLERFWLQIMSALANVELSIRPAASKVEVRQRFLKFIWGIIPDVGMTFARISFY